MLPLLLALVSFVPFGPEWIEVTGHDLVEASQIAEDAVSEPIQQASVSRGMGNRTSDVEAWRPLAAGHFEPGDVDRVLCLIEHESGGNAAARNSSSGASGLLQVMPFWADEYGVSRSDLFEPDINLWISRKIRDTQGWTAWSPYNRGLCRG